MDKCDQYISCYRKDDCPGLVLGPEGCCSYFPQPFDIVHVGDWVETYTAKRFWPLDPRPEDICIEDIAHGLALNCRYGGQCTYMYSVALHSINCAIVAQFRGWSTRMQLLCLLHDAAEFFGLDFARPIKGNVYVKIGDEFVQWKEHEHRIMAAIFEALGVAEPATNERILIKTVDTAVMLAEAKAIMPFKHWGKWDTSIPADIHIQALPAAHVEWLFLKWFRELMAECERRVCK